MSHLISCQSISKAFGAQRLFDEISLGFSEGERLGLIGPNGAGKSTLMKIFWGSEEPDQGKIFRRKGVRLGYLSQSDDLDGEQTIEESFVEAAEKDHFSSSAEIYTSAQQMAGKCGFFDLDQKVASLSGGWLKRLAIGRALIRKPDLLMMDEPTNHLDMAGVLWLEKVLSSARFAFVLISHDRYFLNSVTNRIIELSQQYPDGYLRVEGKYEDFLRRKSDLIAVQEKSEATLGNKLRREVEWLSRGPKARTTKARYRIDDAARLKNDFKDVKDRNSQNKKISLGFSATDRKTKKLLTVRGISKSFDGYTVFSDLDLMLTPGTCIGILGNNGSGKSTLMNILAGRVKPDMGSVKQADRLKIALFDQKRADLDQKQTLRVALAPEGDSVTYMGRSLHVVSWAKKFLFRPDQLDMPVNRLSGGEQARILLASLMRQEVDVLLLDEPTNDLDIPSLEVLEESLEIFPGAVVLVSHDRFLLSRLADYVIGFDGEGNWTRYGDFVQWLDDLKTKTAIKESAKAVQPKVEKVKLKKLTLGEELEMSKIEKTIADAEAVLSERQAVLDMPDIQSDPDRLEVCCRELQESQDEVDRLYCRWEELEKKAGGNINI